MSVKFINPRALLSGEYSMLVTSEGSTAQIVDVVREASLNGLSFISVPTDFGTLYLDPDIEVGVPDEEPRVFCLYFVGYSREEAFAGLPFDSMESAEDYRNNEGGNIYSAQVSVLGSGFLQAEDTLTEEG